MFTNDEAKRRLLQQKLQEQQMQATLKIISSQVLDAKARERLSNLKAAKPDLAMQLEMYLAQLYQAGQLRTKITDEQLILILRKLGEKREFRIKRK
jgi:programmed cell death protein 5